MKKWLLFLMMLSVSVAFGASSTNSPVGYWQQIDDVTNRPHSVVKIWSTDNVLYGKVVKGYPDENGNMPNPLCVNCKGDLYNQPIRGMVILSGFTQSDSGVWKNGQLLDPDSGKIYSCQITLSDDGNKLNVRGYVGVSLFGRTQVWIRLKKFKE